MRRTITRATARLFGNAAGEALVVQQFQQGGEALLVAVVGRGAEEQLMLKMGGQGADRLGAQRFHRVFTRLAAAGRGDVVRLVHHQQVKRPWVGASPPLWAAVRAADASAVPA
jgi:hypothetical protein